MRQLNYPVLAVLLVVSFDINRSLGQLIGFFSVKELPEGFEYRDPRTVEASEKAADLAERFQPRQDDDASRKEERARHRSSTHYVPDFKSEVKLGKKLSDGKIFDRFDSNFLEPLVETRSNKILDEIQHEMTTSRNRYLPGQKNPDIVTQPTRLPSRLINKNEKIEESERSKTGELFKSVENHDNPKPTTLSPRKRFQGNNPRPSHSSMTNNHIF